MEGSATVCGRRRHRWTPSLTEQINGMDGADRRWIKLDTPFGSGKCGTLPLASDGP